MRTSNAPSREPSVRGARDAVLPIALAVLALLSMSYPLIAPIFAVGGGITAYVNARQTASRTAWFAVGVCAVVLVSSLAIDLWLLAADTVVGSHTSGSAPN